jgi:hypothetical protein
MGRRAFIANIHRAADDIVDRDDGRLLDVIVKSSRARFDGAQRAGASAARDNPLENRPIITAPLHVAAELFCSGARRGARVKFKARMWGKTRARARCRRAFIELPRCRFQSGDRSRTARYCTTVAASATGNRRQQNSRPMT